MVCDFSFESACEGLVAGVDEAGRGPLAGPVVAAAVILDRHCIPQGINDSKKLQAPAREALFVQLQSCAIIGVGMASVEEIDSINILAATMLAMQRAVAALAPAPLHALIDGNRAPKLACNTQTIVKGDARCLSIAAASIVAKVTRDNIMRELAAEFPHYGWERNAGYGTPAHYRGIATHGVTPHHRKSFAPVRAYLQGEMALDVA